MIYLHEMTTQNYTLLRTENKMRIEQINKEELQQKSRIETVNSKMLGNLNLDLETSSITEGTKPKRL